MPIRDRDRRARRAGRREAAGQRAAAVRGFRVDRHPSIITKTLRASRGDASTQGTYRFPMCRTQGRRCPSCASKGGRAAHNARRRQNRAVRREIAEQAAAAGAPTEVVALLRQAPPSVALAWAGQQGGSGSASAGLASSGTVRPGPPPRTWITAPLLGQIDAAVRSQGGRVGERRLLEGTLERATEVSAGSNDTTAVTFSGGVNGFHKSFAGCDPSVAEAYDQDGYQQPLHEVAAWRVAVALGPPWDQIVPPTVIRTVHGEPGSVSQLMTGQEGASLDRSAVVDAAGLFDALIGQQDRHGGNYLTDGAGLALIDHGYAFARPRDGFHVSQLTEARARLPGGDRLTDAERAALRRLLGSEDLGGTRGLLEPERWAALRARAERMLDAGKILEAGEF